jgi:hypothetical protein
VYLLEVMFVFTFLDLVCLTVVVGFMQLVRSRHSCFRVYLNLVK